MTEGENSLKEHGKNRYDVRQVFEQFVAKFPDVLDFGITSPGRAPSANRLLNFLAQGHAANMDYMHQNLEQRVDTSVFAPWSKSLVFFALKPPTPLRIPTETNPRYSIAAYAQGPDYHYRAKQRLNDLHSELNAFSDAELAPLQFQGFVDTAPVFERDFAAEAGLGWRAKNCTLIHRKLGSHFMLFGCAINWELPPSKPVDAFCGGCTLCIEACPTHAFLSPGELDANKCISYWTIEQRGNIPNALGEQFGEWIFGCDRCQTVCPWNRKHMEPPGELGINEFHQDAQTWLQWLSPGGGFQKRFKRSPLQRAGRKGLLRNIVGAIARQNQTQHLPQLETMAQHETDDMVLTALRKAIIRLKNQSPSSESSPTS